MYDHLVYLDSILFCMCFLKNHKTRSKQKNSTPKLEIKYYAHQDLFQSMHLFLYLTKCRKNINFKITKRNLFIQLYFSLSLSLSITLTLGLK